MPLHAERCGKMDSVISMSLNDAFSSCAFSCRLSVRLLSYINNDNTHVAQDTGLGMVLDIS